jgi:hypothetical protein
VKPSSGAYWKPLLPFPVEELVGDVNVARFSSDRVLEKISGRVDTVVVSFGWPRAFLEVHILSALLEIFGDQCSGLETRHDKKENATRNTQQWRIIAQGLRQ